MIQYGEKADKLGADKVEGTIRLVGPRGSVTLQDGTILAVPRTLMAQDRLKPGVVIVAEYEAKGLRNIATSVQIRNSDRA